MQAWGHTHPPRGTTRAPDHHTHRHRRTPRPDHPAHPRPPRPRPDPPPPPPPHPPRHTHRPRRPARPRHLAHRTARRHLRLPHLAPPHPDHAADFITALAHHARHIVYLSSATADPHAPDPHDSTHGHLENLITRSGAHWTLLRPGTPAATTLRWAPRIRTHRTVHSTRPHPARPLIHEADIADVAVHALTHPEHHHERTHHLTGPHHHTEAEQVRILAQVLDLPLTHTAPHDPASAEPEPATTTVEKILRRPARSYRQWVADHATDFR
ncbi:hypothetical protein HFP72_33990 [Nocardiopsis sp. ARC36]